MSGAVRLLSSLVVVLVAAGCAPKAGTLRHQHPLLGRADGEAPLTAPGPGLLFGEGATPLDTPEANSARSRVASSAKAFVGQRSVVVAGERYRFDCSGVARGIYARAGVPLGGTPSFRGENDVSVLYRYVRENGSLRKSDPLVGDLVFFDDTYDRNGDGLRNDPLSHVGVVEEVLDDGTVVFVHHAAGGILRYRMNLSSPDLRRDPTTKRTLNHYLRRAEGGQPAKTTAQLFVAYGTVVTGRAPLVASR